MTYSQRDIEALESQSIIAWLHKNQIKNEKGELIEFKNHPFLYDIYIDRSPNLVCLKSAQIGMSTLEILKNHFDAKSRKLDIIYTLPTQEDVQTFVGGKVNRIIKANPCMMEDTTDKDTIEQKAIGPSMMYWRGTWTAKAAIMVTADRLVHDEIDSSKQSVIADYQARLQHSKYKETHVFSHPSSPGVGVDMYWRQSDQKEWFITCPFCQKEQYLSWSTSDPKRMSVDLEREEFVCKSCQATLSDDVRRNGRWVKKKLAAKFSGYHISLLMAPWISAKDIKAKWLEVVEGKQTEDFFYNKILGLPFTGGGNTVSKDAILGNIREGRNPSQGRLVIGVDTGIKLRYVVGNKGGLLGYGEMTDYSPDETNRLPLNQTIEYFLEKFPGSIMVIDQGGDIIGSRKLQKKYPGRVFLCHYARDRKTQQLIRWGEKDETGTVLADRNRMIQLVIDEFKDRRIPLWNGKEADWYDYYLHWSHIYRTVEENNLGVPEYVWQRSDRDDWVHATVYWRIGMSKFGGTGTVLVPDSNLGPNSYYVNPNQTVDFSPEEMFKLPDWEGEEDWRNIG